MSQIEIFEANLGITLHSQAVIDLINSYAADPMGMGEPLPPDVQKNLIAGLTQHPTTIIFLAFHEGKAVGIITCFKGFSTFFAKPMLQISDFFLQPEHRGLSIASMLLASVEKKAAELNCCKITMTALKNNTHAIGVYESAGFRQETSADESEPRLCFSKYMNEDT